MVLDWASCGLRRAHSECPWRTLRGSRFVACPPHRPDRTPRHFAERHGHLPRQIAVKSIRSPFHARERPAGGGSGSAGFAGAFAVPSVRPIGQRPVRSDRSHAHRSSDASHRPGNDFAADEGEVADECGVLPCPFETQMAAISVPSWERCWTRRRRASGPAADHGRGDRRPAGGHSCCALEGPVAAFKTKPRTRDIANCGLHQALCLIILACRRPRPGFSNHLMSSMPSRLGSLVAPASCHIRAAIGVISVGEPNLRASETNKFRSFSPVDNAPPKSKRRFRMCFKNLVSVTALRPELALTTSIMTWGSRPAATPKTAASDATAKIVRDALRTSLHACACPARRQHGKCSCRRLA